MNRKLIFAVFVVFAIAAIFLFDLGQYFSLAQLKDQRAAILEAYTNNPILVASLFFALYIVVAALPIPGGAVILTLTAGAVFGFFMGLVLVSFASSIGATLAFLSSRYLLRDFVQQKFAKWLEPINKGFKADGPFYVFGLRLVPVFSFVMVNLVLALTPLKTWTFYWASQLGMLAGTAVYVNAGTQLIKLESISDIANPTLLVSFALLGVFPIFAKLVLNMIKRKRSAEQENKV